MITAITPSGDVGKAVDVVVTNRDSQEAKRVGGFTPVRLVVSKIEPESGSEVGGSIISIRGDGFIEGTIVKIGGELTVKSNPEISSQPRLPRIRPV